LFFMALRVDAVTGSASADDAAAFERAVTPEARRLFGLALTILGDHGEAEDAVQETMFSAWRSWGQLRNRTAPGPWLTRICVNHCIHRRRGMLQRLLWPAERTIPATPSPLPVLDDRLLGFDAAFRRLSPSQRAAFVLHVHHGYTVEECAELLACRPGTVRSHLGRAVAKLKRDLTDA
jgi:RNA polymerase sigma-70 factor (ECF subfamily)